LLLGTGQSVGSKGEPTLQDSIGRRNKSRVISRSQKKKARPVARPKIECVWVEEGGV